VDEVLLGVVACAVCQTSLHNVDGNMTNPVLPFLTSHQTLDSTVSTSFLHHLHEPVHTADAGACGQGASRGGDHAAALPGFAEVFDHAVADSLGTAVAQGEGRHLSWIMASGIFWRVKQRRPPARS
jgi:hypothetical protein